VVCMRSGVSLEVRTTIFPEMPSASEVSEVAKTLSKMMSEFPGHHLEEMVLQQGRPVSGVSGPAAFDPVALDSLEEMAAAMRDLVKVRIRAAPNVSIAKTDNHQDIFCQGGRTEV
jgi:hypothetical protein